jgi:NAD+ diphosphatase
MGKYCHLCGGLNIKGKTQPSECSNCHNLRFENASPTVDLILFNEEGKVLITERGVDPAKGKYDLPGGFVDLDETLEEAIAREVQEELGLAPDDYTTPVYQESQSVQYSYSKEVRTVLGSIFAAKLKTKQKINPQDDVASIKFVSIDDLSTIDFSLDTYPEIIKSAHKKLFT